MRHLAPTDTCRAIDELRLPWPYTRSIWRRNPVFRREPTARQIAKGECGHVNHCALDILEDVIGWYRIKRTRDERTGEVISEERLFDGDRLQKDYSQWGDDLGYSKRQMQEGVALLHDAGVITRACEVTRDNYGVNVGNAVFIEPCPEAIRALSRPVPASDGDTPPLTLKRERSPVKTGEGTRETGRGVPQKRETPKSLKSSKKSQASHKQEQQEAAPLPTPSPTTEGAVVVASDKKFEGKEARSADTKAAPDTDPPLDPDAVQNPGQTPQEALALELISEGMGEAQARAAARDRYDVAVEQLSNLRHVLPTEKIEPSRGGWLYLAITRGYGPTKGHEKWLKDQKDRAARRPPSGGAKAASASGKTNTPAAQPLSPEQIAALLQKARNCVHPDFRELGEAKCQHMISQNFSRLKAGEEMQEHKPWPEPVDLGQDDADGAEDTGDADDESTGGEDDPFDYV